MREIKVSSQFKAQTFKAIMAISLFVLTYLLMLVLAIGLTILCVYGGLKLMLFRIMFATIVLGLGLASLGVLVLFFLLKFIFKSHKVDRSHLIEISKHEEPKFFELVEEIVREVDTSFPKKIYLSADVNAAVFYDSSFWSMFFPIKKNLQIGLGLVNTVSVSELKAVLSHEFGHFSQRSMKVGSYVYNVNQVIFNLLYDNELYDRIVQKWTDTSSYFSFFIIIALKITNGIKWVLSQLYKVVNICYMGLSREMEFHADEIAANVTGREPLKSSLLRISLADHAFNSVLSFYDQKIADNQKSGNIFKEQLFVLNFIAHYNNIVIKNNLPQILDNDLNKYNKSKLIIKDQWTSHPSTEDRIANLEKSGLTATSFNNEPANLIFADIESTQMMFTNMVFKDVIYPGECITIPLETFKSDYIAEFSKNTFPQVYNSYYDNKNPTPFDIQNIEPYSKDIRVEDLFSDEKVDLVYNAIALQNDIEMLKQISNKTIDAKTFDYDGTKYTLKDCNDLIHKLEIELSKLNEVIILNDIDIFRYFRGCEQKNGISSVLENIYIQFFNYEIEFNSKHDVYVQLKDALQFVDQSTPRDQIIANFLKVESLEKILKKEISELLENPDYIEEFTKKAKENFVQYLSKKWQYFGDGNYYEDNLMILVTAINDYSSLLPRGYFLLKKKLLMFQVELMKNKH